MSGSWALVWSVTRSGRTAPDELGQDVGGIADSRPTPIRSARHPSTVVTPSSSESVELVDVAVLQPPPRPRIVDLDDERRSVVHRDRQRLGAAHAAEAGGQRRRPGQAAAEVLAAASANVSYVPWRIPCVPM